MTMSALTANQQALLDRILRAYGLHEGQILTAQSGYRNTAYPIQLPDGRHLNLILYKQETGILDKIHAANRVSNYLATRHFPTRVTTGRIILLRSPSRTKYACFYNYLPGHTIPWEAYTKAHVKLLGLAMSQLHATLAAAPLTVAADAAVEFEGTRQYMAEYFDRPGVQPALAAKLGLALAPHALTAARHALRLARALPERQILHMDFVRGNILFGPSSAPSSTTAPTLSLGNLAITGILDFEKTATGPRVLDIARTLAFLIVDCKTKTPDAVIKYFLHSGYNKRGRLPFAAPIITQRGRRINLLSELIDFFLLHDFFKFLEHNPYESLPQNEHFVRTRDLLIGLGYLQTVTN